MKIIELNEQNKKELEETLQKRSTSGFKDIEDKVSGIISEVRERGDAALFDFSKQFDHFDLNADNIRITTEEMDEALSETEPEFRGVLERAVENIKAFHEKQLRQTWIDMKPDGTILGQRFTPIEIAGVYVPGGKAAYPSSLLMNVVPAKVAGVERIVMLTPPGKDGKVSKSTLAAARIAGVTEAYRVGGAQAIAAMAYGTESIPRVYKICGPGNIFVAMAKKAVYGQVSIDSVAGPSEIMVLADDTADARFVAADLLSQAHPADLQRM